MTVRELHKAMKELNRRCPDATVIMLPVVDDDNLYYVDDVTSAHVFKENEEQKIELGIRELTPEYVANGYDENDVMKDGTKCVVIMGT